MALIETPTSHQTSVPVSIPPPLAAQFERPDKKKAIREHCTRFKK